MKPFTLLFALAALVVAGLAFAQDPAPTPITPQIAWAPAGPIRDPAPLTAAQLTAHASVPGTFVYDPPLGTVLAVGNGQTLTATFTPDDTALYTTATASATIDVIPTYWPYDPSEPAYVCHMNPDLQTPVFDAATGLPRCFVVPVPVSVSLTKHLLTQTSGLNADGSVAYKYPTWWDYIIKFFLNDLVLPMLDKYPPEGVAQAKADAEAAAKAVDAAKATIIGVDPTTLQPAQP